MVKLVGDGYTGEVVTLQEALNKAEDADLDLVQMGNIQNDGTAVCKILDYSKMLYNQQKKAKQNKKSKQDVKELRLTDTIAENDIKTKAKNADKFINSGAKVIVSVVYKGRTISFINHGFSVLKAFESHMVSDYKIDKAAKIEGNKVTMVLVPNIKGK